MTRWISASLFGSAKAKQGRLPSINTGATTTAQLGQLDFSNSTQSGLIVLLLEDF